MIVSLAFGKVVARIRINAEKWAIYICYMIGKNWSRQICTAFHHTLIQIHTLIIPQRIYLTTQNIHSYKNIYIRMNSRKIIFLTFSYFLRRWVTRILTEKCNWNVITTKKQNSPWHSTSSVSLQYNVFEVYTKTQKNADFDLSNISSYILRYHLM